MERLSDKRGFTDFRDEKTLLRAGSALLAALKAVGSQRKCAALGESYNLTSYSGSGAKAYSKDTDEALRMAHFFVPFSYMDYMLQHHDGYPLLSPRFAGEEAYYAGVEPTPNFYAILAALQNARGRRLVPTHRLDDEPEGFCGSITFEFSHPALGRQIGWDKHNEMRNRLITPTAESIPHLADADAFLACVLAKLDEVVRIYSQHDLPACNAIVADAQLVRAKFLEKLNAASQALGSKRERDWLDASHANKRAPLPCQQEPVDLPDATGFLCPISQSLMQDPVLCTLDQRTYERENITKALKQNRKSPLTSKPLAAQQPIDSVLVPNQGLRDAITFFVPRMLRAAANGASLV